MMNVKIVTQNKEDKELLKSYPIKYKFTVEFLHPLKEGKNLKRYYGARLNPFVEVKVKDKLLKAFYSEQGDAIQQFIKWIVNDTNL